MRTVTMYVERGYEAVVNHKLLVKLLKKHKGAAHVFYSSSKIELCIPVSETVDQRLSFDSVGAHFATTSAPKSMRSSSALQYIEVPTLPRNYKGVV